MTSKDYNKSGFPPMKHHKMSTRNWCKRTHEYNGLHTLPLNMKIEISPEGGERYLPLSVSGQTEKVVSEISHDEVSEFSQDHDQIDNLDFDIGSGGEVETLDISIPGIISLQIDNGEITEFSLYFPSVEVTAINDQNNESHLDASVNKRSGEIIKKGSSAQDLPPVPSIETESIPEDYLKRYKSMKNEDTQPYKIRKIVYDNKTISRGELKDKLNQLDYDVEAGETHTGVSSTLRLLDEYTQEIQREGRGESKTLKWVGDGE